MLPPEAVFPGVTMDASQENTGQQSETQTSIRPPQPQAVATTRRRGGISTTAAPPRRQGKRSARPPVPAAPVDDVVDLTDSSVADWCDENVRIVCEIFAEECEIGNRSSTHLNKAGYKNVIQKFKDRTGKEYTRRQFKNKWDKLKVEYGVWKHLTRQTGLGWDGGNIIMPEEWWKRMSKAIKGSSKFKERGLQNEDKLAAIFEDLRNTGDDHWCPSSGLPPSQSSLAAERSAINVEEEDEGENDDDDDSEPEEVTPTSARGKRVVVNDNNKGKRPKSSTRHWFQEHMDQIAAMNERTTTSCESIARMKEKSGSSIQEVMTLVKECGAIAGSDEHFTATLLFTRTAEREMFMTLETPEQRFLWLKRKHQWMNRNDVA